jgi:hypothetical protein
VSKWYSASTRTLKIHTANNQIQTLQITLPAAFDSNQPTISEETLKIKQANLTGEVLEASSRGRVASTTVIARSNYSFIIFIN